MDDLDGTGSNASSLSLTPPQSRIPLSSTAASPSMTTETSTSELLSILNSRITLPQTTSRSPIFSTMNKDACFTHIHMHHSSHADLFDEFCKDRLPKDDVYVPPDLQPVNPEEEDDVVPDQHAAYGVQKATQKAREPAWKDLGLAELMARGPMAAGGAKEGGVGGGGVGGGGGGGGNGRRRGAGRRRGGGFGGLPR